MQLIEGVKYHENGLILKGKFVYVQDLGEMWLEKGVLSSKFGDRLDGIWRNMRKVGNCVKGEFRGLVRFYAGKEIFRECFVTLRKGTVRCFEREIRKGCGLAGSCCFLEMEMANHGLYY